MGGFLGTTLRYIIDSLIPHSTTEIPWSIVIINLLGCFLFGFVSTMIFLRKKISSIIKVGIENGLLGSFTTFSTFSLQTVELIQKEYFFQASLYILISILGGLVMTYIGTCFARRREIKAII